MSRRYYAPADAPCGSWNDLIGAVHSRGTLYFGCLMMSHVLSLGSAVGGRRQALLCELWVVAQGATQYHA